MFLPVFLVQNWRYVLIALFPLFMIPLILIGGIFGQFQQETNPDIGGGMSGKALVTPEVRRYEPLVRQASIKYGVESHVNLLLAKIMQESGGRLPDVMQSSESLGLPRNTISDPAVSIDVGVKYFASILKKTKGDVKLALQSYNFGSGFIDYALKRGGYSKRVAIEFSEMMASKQGWDRYGDVNYVDNVLRYLEVEAAPVNSFGFIMPIIGKITSHFGYRIHPITKEPKLHAGTDFGCGQKPVPIKAVKEGKVISAGWQDPSNHKAGYGQRIIIKHSNGLETVYAHLSKMTVKSGQKVSQGQQIGNCGTTGSSTGMHLHFELVVNGQKEDALPYLN
jgi:murein DD-endopeptidase MepM/ murein hydrolase activator NlpD